LQNSFVGIAKPG